MPPLSPLIRTVADADVIVSAVDNAITAKKFARMLCFPVASYTRANRVPNAGHLLVTAAIWDYTTFFYGGGTAVKLGCAAHWISGGSINIGQLD